MASHGPACRLGFPWTLTAPARKGHEGSCHPPDVWSRPAAYTRWLIACLIAAYNLSLSLREMESRTGLFMVVILVS